MASHLIPVPDDPTPDDAPDPLHVEITDTDLTFVGALGPLKIDGRTSALLVQLIIDPQSPVTNKDFQPLQHRHLRVTISPTTRSGAPADPRVDPVAEQVERRRLERLIAAWVVPGRAAAHPDPDPTDLP